MNVVSYFSEKNLVTVDKIINDSITGGYDVLKYLLLFKTHMDNTDFKKGTLYDYLKLYVAAYIRNLRNVPNIETSLFVSKKIELEGDRLINVSELAITAFVLILINKNKGI